MKNSQVKHYDEAMSALEKLSDDELSKISFVMPWQAASSSSSTVDEDGFSTGVSTVDSQKSRSELQKECWLKFHTNPQVNTAVRGLVGRLTGEGFEVSSQVPLITEAIEETEFDWRNRLYNYWPKFTGRTFIEGELYLCLSVHEDAFIEVDFIDPDCIDSNAIETGIIYHPSKTMMPLFYSVKSEDPNTGATTESLIPSVFVARYPELYDVAATVKGFNKKLVIPRSRKSKYKKIGGFTQFIVAWDRSFITRRNVSYLRTTLEWLNHYENLKKYEIDHKKSAGAYLWVVTIEDPRAFRVWLSLTEDEKRSTGIMAKKTPGGTLVLPPGMKIEVKNPNLPNISESDTDILHMVTSGLNEPEDVSTGQSKGTFASVKASRGPMSDRVSDEIAYFKRFLIYDFYSSVFFLKSSVSNFPEFFKVRQAVDFKNRKPIFELVKKRPEFLIDVSFPISEVNDPETRARAFLGVKHGSVYDTLGIPNQEIARKLGLGNYKKLRLMQATEEENYPELVLTADAESVQESTEAEPPNAKKKPKTKKIQKEE